MNSANLELIINRADSMLAGRLYLRGSEVVAGPNQYRRLIRNDAGVASVRICEPCFTGERAFNDINPSGNTIAIALGSLDRVPSTGTFPLGVSSSTSGTLTIGKRYYISTFVAGDIFTNVGAAANATGTIFTATGTTPTVWTNGSTVKEITSDLAVDATAVEVQDALNLTVAVAVAGGVTVTSPRPGAYEVTFVSSGDQAAITAPIASNMFPTSIIVITTVRGGSANVREVQVIQLKENPYCYAALSTAFAAAAASVTTIQAQTASLSAIKKLTLEPMPYGGTMLVTLDGVTFEAPWNATGKEMNDLAGSNYTVVRRATNAWEFTRITVNTAMSLSVDVTNLSVALGVTGAMALNTWGMFEAFASTEADTLRLRLEVNYTKAGGTPQKIYQEIIEVHRDLIDAANLVTPTLNVTTPTFGQSNDITVSATGSTDLSPGVAFIQWFQLVTCQAGSAGWTHKLTLDTANAVIGSIYRIELDIDASTNPTIEICNESISGTLLQVVNGQADAATYFLFEARFDGTEWRKFNGSYLT